jgi:hypothetical protein
MNFFKKLGLFFNYRKALKEGKSVLKDKFNIRVDGAQRMYTVINVPEELIGDAYSLKASDINRISENYIKSYSEELSKFLNAKGINELYEIYEVKKVGKYSYLLVIGFRLFKSHFFYNTIYYGVIPSLVVILSIIFFLV